MKKCQTSISEMNVNYYKEASFANRISKSEEGEDILLVTNLRDIYLCDCQDNFKGYRSQLPIIAIKIVQYLVLASLINEKAYGCTDTEKSFEFLYGYLILFAAVALLQNSFVPSIKEIIFLWKLREFNKGNNKKLDNITTLLFLDMVLGIGSCIAVVLTISTSTEFFSMLEDCLSLALLYELDDALLKFVEIRIKIDPNSVKVHEENKADIAATSMNISKIVYVILVIASIIYRSTYTCTIYYYNDDI